MPWYFYLLEFLGGAFLANGVPHFVQGISGNPFPSPFAKPPGEGDSSPLVNVLWGFGNFVAGALLLHSSGRGAMRRGRGGARWERVRCCCGFSCRCTSARCGRERAKRKAVEAVCWVAVARR